MLGSAKYARYCFAYGATRKVLILKNAQEKHRGDKTMPMLTSTKAGLVAIGSLSALTLWPFYAMCDANALEVMWRTRRMEEQEKREIRRLYKVDYREPKTFFEFLFM